MMTIRETATKEKVRKRITREVRRLSKKGKVQFTTLFDGDFSHEEGIFQTCSNVRVVSVNRAHAVVNAATPLNKYHRVIRKTLGTERDWGMEKADCPHVIWFDFCRLLECWDGFFHALKRMDKKTDTAFATFSAIPRGWKKRKTRKWLESRFGEITSPESMAELIIEAAKREARKLGFKVIYKEVYTVKAGRMITVGFRRGSHKIDESEKYVAAIDAAEKMRQAGLKASDIVKLFGDSRKVAGLFRAATCRNT